MKSVKSAIGGLFLLSISTATFGALLWMIHMVFVSDAGWPLALLLAGFAYVASKGIKYGGLIFFDGIQKRRLGGMARIDEVANKLSR